MLKINLIAIVYILILHVSSVAQSNDSSKSEMSTNYGLMFEKETEYRVADSSFIDVIQLFNLCDKAQAMQFRLLMNKAPDDSTILIFKDIQKGTDLSDPSWLLDFNVIKDTVTQIGASQDEIYVVLYNMNHNSGLLPGDYKNLFTVNYRVTNVNGLQGDIKSSMKISHAEASTFQGDAIDIKPSRDEFKIVVKGK
jgi:hypothetical protein